MAIGLTEKARVVIANGASLSSVVDLREKDLLAIQMPAAWTAAALTFAATGYADNSDDLQTYQKVVDSGGTEINYTVAAATYIVLTDAERARLSGMMRAKLRSGTTGAAVNQGAAREIWLIVANR